MCIVIDANVFSMVFNSSNSEHVKFLPILRWVDKGKGKLVYGGTKYQKELEKADKTRRLFKLFQDAGKAVHVDDNKVDLEEAILEQLVDNRAFNDKHLVAIIRVSKCRLVCSMDVAAQKYLRDVSLYPSGTKRPSIYKGHRRHEKLLCDKNIVAICRTCI